ncbi:MAG: winged helix-turn-helix domain-containing protein [Flavobacteriales bacterium]
MEHESFYINNRFFTNPSTNIIKEIKGANEIRLEPRLMLLLCILSKNEGKVVSREFLIKEIWNDYGGADEGLTQAISFLRKVIGDKNKEIIETVPKKGYILHATISKNINEEEIRIEKTKQSFYKYLIAILVLVVLISGYVILKKPFSKTNIHPLQITSPADTKENKDKSVSFPDLSQGEEENYLNTITTADANGVKYKLVMIGDRRPKFYVNDKLVTGEILEEYTLLIDKLAKELWARQSRTKTSVK